jgi:signal peptidase I
MKIMSQLTAALFVLLAGYVLMLLTGRVTGNFAALLLTITAVSGLYWLAERLYFRRQRELAAARAEAELKARYQQAARDGIKLDSVDVQTLRANILRQPWWLEWTAGLFGVLAVVFLLRSFVAEPFRVPSGSMLPTIVEGDLILVNKFRYGLRLPVINTRITQGQPPRRGDIIVFHLPKDPSVDYIKRLVGVPGDTVAYLNKRLTINGVELSKTPQPDYFEEQSTRYARRYEEKLGNVSHSILNYEQAPPFIAAADQFPYRENCQYSNEGVVCKVPPGHYFMMGDNRDNSQDSRYWGFVPEANIVGKAFFVWFNLGGNFRRIGSIE